MYGGYGSYGSSYGGGYGGYSSIGGSYGGMGSSYGSYGSSYGMNRTLSNPQNPPNNQDPNRPAQQEINERKMVVEQYFKMMGGLRSMVQIGFSMVALCNFASRSWELLKKLVLFLTKTSKKLFYKLSGAQVLTDKMASAFEKAMLLSPNSKNGHTILNKFLTGLRLAAAIILVLGIKLKSKLNKEIQGQHDEILKKYEKIKLEQTKIIEKERELEIEIYDGEYSHVKEGYF